MVRKRVNGVGWERSWGWGGDFSQMYGDGGDTGKTL